MLLLAALALMARADMCNNADRNEGCICVADDHTYDLSSLAGRQVRRR